MSKYSVLFFAIVVGVLSMLLATPAEATPGSERRQARREARRAAVAGFFGFGGCNEGSAAACSQSSGSGGSACGRRGCR